MKMSLTTNRELTNQTVSPNKFILDVDSKDFRRDRTQAIISISTNHKLIDKISKFDFTDSRMEKKFAHQYHH